MKISEIIRHPQYSFPASYNDIALLKLEKKLKLRYMQRPAVRPACLPQSEPPSNSVYTATGWGRLSSFGGQYKRFATVTVKCLSCKS